MKCKQKRMQMKITSLLKKVKEMLEGEECVKERWSLCMVFGNTYLWRSERQNIYTMNSAMKLRRLLGRVFKMLPHYFLLITRNIKED